MLIIFILVMRDWKMQHHINNPYGHNVWVVAVGLRVDRSSESGLAGLPSQPSNDNETSNTLHECSMCHESQIKLCQAQIHSCRLSYQQILPFSMSRRSLYGISVTQSAV